MKAKRSRSGICGCALALAIVLGLAVLAAPSAQAQSFTTFEAPGAGTGTNQGTVPISINTAGATAGIYWDGSNLAHGFVRAANGTLTDFDAPGAGTGKNQGTFPFSIDTAGDIAGMYSDASNVYHGFVRAANGTITDFDAPGAGLGGHAGTTPMSINTVGAIAGTYRDVGLVYHGFVRAADGTITTFDAPGAGTSTYLGTEPVSINTAGDIAGAYRDASAVAHGFVRAANGTITTFDAPGAGTGPGTPKGFPGVGTLPISINTAGDVAGAYTDANRVAHAFVRSANGAITTFDAPGASTGTGMLPGTVGGSISDAGNIAGMYSDASAVLHGFVRAANGTITTFDAPGVGAGMGIVQGTAGFSINAAGNITGAYTDASAVVHGFVLTPATGGSQSPTKTNLTSGANPAIVNSFVTFTAMVAPTGTMPPTGTVTFQDGATVIGTATLNASSVATFTTSGLGMGVHSITAVYGGDASNAGSTSAVVTETIVSGGGAAVPVLTSLSPSSAVAGGSPFVLTLNGSNFVSGAAVLWNGSSRTTTFISSTQLQATITDLDIVTAGVTLVAVNNPASAGDNSNPQTFAILELVSGSSGYLSMFVNGTGLGNSALFQSNGLIGLNTTTPQATLDVQLTTGSTNNAVNSTINLNNSTAISCCVLSAFKMTLNDVSTATNLSKQPARFVYLRDAAATGGVSAFDAIMTATSFFSANAPYQLRGVNIEGPTIPPSLTLGNFTGLYIGSGGGGGTVTSRYALVTEANAGNVGIGTTAPATALHVNGNARLGTSASDLGCLQGFTGTALAGTCSSDARLKTNILPFAPVLNQLVKLQPVHFEWDAEQYPDYHFGPGRNSGLLAQDVEKVFPEMVAVDAHGFKMVNYSELPYLTLVAIRELKTENDSLRAQLAERQRELEELRQQVVSVQARLARLEKPPSRTAKKKKTVQPTTAAGAKAQH